jgi:UDP-glucose 6-dehydrogenase
MKAVGIVGFGYVGRALHKIFPDAYVYDPNVTDEEVAESYHAPVHLVSKAQLNAACELAIVCVPTPMLQSDDEFKGVDVSIVEEVVGWLETPLILIKSTIPPGTSARLEAQSQKNICFSPEYVGQGRYYVSEWRYVSPTDPRTHEFVIIGGRPGIRDDVAEFFIGRLGPEKVYYLVEAVEAEMIKYMENCWGAVKVIFAAEFYELCQKAGASYVRVREGWALDNRVERMHTAVFAGDLGFDGKCYPKDLNGIVRCADAFGADLSLIKATLRKNQKLRQQGGGSAGNSGAAIVDRVVGAPQC